jgi:hypothetical protein
MVPKSDPRRRLTSRIRILVETDLQMNQDPPPGIKKSLLPNFLLPPKLLYTHLIAKACCTLVFYATPANGIKTNWCIKNIY